MANHCANPKVIVIDVIIVGVLFVLLGFMFGNLDQHHLRTHQLVKQHVNNTEMMLEKYPVVYITNYSSEIPTRSMVERADKSNASKVLPPATPPFTKTVSDSDLHDAAPLLKTWKILLSGQLPYKFPNYRYEVNEIGRLHRSSYLGDIPMQMVKRKQLSPDQAIPPDMS